MTRISPLIRISLGLVTLTCSILLGLDLIGIVPSPDDGVLRARTQLCESLAGAAAAAAERNDLGTVRTALQLAVKRQEDVLSAALRAANGRILVAAGDHDDLWNDDPENVPAGTHVRIPIYRGERPWGRLEVRFRQRAPSSLLEGLWERPMVRLLLLVSVAGFVAYMLYMKRTLKHLDPSAVIPARVQAALDVMAEGVVLIDEHERIVLANSTFAELSGMQPAALLGLKASDLNWRVRGSDEKPRSFPWSEAIASGKPAAGVRFQLTTRSTGVRSFVVKGAPILDGNGRSKGAIATFDDVTEFEKRGQELEKALAELEKSRDEIRLQSEELEALARFDPLTGVTNRRSFMTTYEPYLPVARHEGEALSCLMIDVDEFRLVNDTEGHAGGDEVIRRVAEALVDVVRSHEAVCRYGGDEFCVLLRETPLDRATAVAERIRRTVASPGFARVPVTVTIGISELSRGARTLLELINQADEALYAAKRGGRNRVASWDDLKSSRR